MAPTDKKELGRIKRHKRLRQKVSGTAQRPRLSIHRSLKNLFAQLVDDSKSITIISLSTCDKIVKNKIKNGGDVKAAVTLGEEFAKLAKSKGIEKIVFDRGGYLFHGRIKAFAEAARASGLKF